MNWMPRIVLIVALSIIPAVAMAQAEPAADEKQPAPGEPSGILDAADVVERFEREVSPIEGTEPDTASETSDSDTRGPTDAAETARPATADSSDVAAEVEQLRREIEQRLIALERRLDEQIVRIDALTATTVTANKPTENSEAMEAQSDERFAQLKADLEQLRSDISEQLQAAAMPDGDGSSTPAAGGGQPGIEGHRLRIHNTTGVEQPISINGVQWTVRTDEWSSVPIPRGPVTVHRPGQAPLEIAAEEIEWQNDKRGYYFDYDLDAHRVARPVVQ